MQNLGMNGCAIWDHTTNSLSPKTLERGCRHKQLEWSVRRSSKLATVIFPSRYLYPMSTSPKRNSSLLSCEHSRQTHQRKNKTYTERGKVDTQTRIRSGLPVELLPVISVYYHSPKVLKLGRGGDAPLTGSRFLEKEIKQHGNYVKYSGFA